MLNASQFRFGLNKMIVRRKYPSFSVPHDYLEKKRENRREPKENNKYSNVQPGLFLSIKVVDVFPYISLMDVFFLFLRKTLTTRKDLGI